MHWNAKWVEKEEISRGKKKTKKGTEKMNIKNLYGWQVN